MSLEIKEFVGHTPIQTSKPLTKKVKDKKTKDKPKKTK